MASAPTIELPQFKGRPGWEFTDLSGFDPAAFAPAPADADLVAPEALLEGPAGAVGLLQVDGASEAGEPAADPRSAPPTGAGRGPVVLPLSVARERHPELVEPHLGSIVDTAGDPFASWNAEAWEGGAFVHVPRGVRVEAPILLTAVSQAAGTALHRRTLVVVEEGAEAEVWEQLQSGTEADATLVTTVVELVVQQGARLRYVCGQDLNERSWIFGAQRAEVARDGYLDWVAVGFGAAKGRMRMETRLTGEGAEAKVTGAYAPHARQHIDFDTTQEHAAPNTISDLAFRGILADRSTAVWKGNIIVDPGAQKTDAFQECRNLLVSKRAHADAIPGLEILANDVRCTHAAAVAQVDKEQLFYLRSRGLDDAMAKRLVIEGFLQELVERFDEGAFRDAVSGALERRLAKVLDKK